MAPVQLRRLLSRNLREAIARKKASVVALSDFASVSPAHLYDILGCRKAATVDVLAKLAGALEVAPYRLLEPEGSRAKADAEKVQKPRARRNA